MNEQYVYRIVNNATGEFYRSKNGHAIWTTPGAVRVAYSYIDNDAYSIRTYKLVEVT